MSDDADTDDLDEPAEPMDLGARVPNPEGTDLGCLIFMLVGGVAVCAIPFGGIAMLLFGWVWIIGGKNERAEALRHRLDGETDDEEGVAPELRGWASLEWIRLQIDNPGNGTTYPPGIMDPDFEGHMPAYRDDLSPQEIALLAGWVYEQATGREHEPAED